MAPFIPERVRRKPSAPVENTKEEKTHREKLWLKYVEAVKKIRSSGRSITPGDVAYELKLPYNQVYNYLDRHPELLKADIESGSPAAEPAVERKLYSGE